MSANAQTGSPQTEASQGPVGGLGNLYRASWLLVALATIAIGLACFFYPWLGHELKPRLEPYSFHVWVGVVLMAAGTGIAAGPRVRMWALPLGAVALLASLIGRVIPYSEIVDTRDQLIRIALIGAMMMLTGLKRRRDGRRASAWLRWFGVGRWMFTGCALLLILIQAVESYWLQSGFDMFYLNYNVVTLFNSLWSWSYPLQLIFGWLALLAAAAICFRPLARVGAFWLAGVSMVFLPLLFLYRADDFCGDRAALIEIIYCWALDLGLAGGALVVAAGFRRPKPAAGVDGRPVAGASRVFSRRRWVRAAWFVAAILAAAMIALHGLIPTIFYKANTQGDRRLGELATQIYAATYVHASGDYSWDKNLADEIRDAGADGLVCASGDPQGCADMSGFYREIGWNWGRAWLLSAKAEPLFVKNVPLLTAQCQSGDRTACFNLGMQYDLGEGVAVDLDLAQALYDKACNANEGDACARLGDMEWVGYGPMWDEAKGIALLQKGCGLGSQWGCRRLRLLGPLAN